MEFQVKVWILLTWQKRSLVIKDNIFEIQKADKKKKKEAIRYPLYSAVLIDQSKDNDLQILVGTSRDFIIQSFYKAINKGRQTKNHIKIRTKNKTIFFPKYFQSRLYKEQ